MWHDGTVFTSLLSLDEADARTIVIDAKLHRSIQTCLGDELARIDTQPLKQQQTSIVEKHKQRLLKPEGVRGP
jgi:hypothetical protein